MEATSFSSFSYHRFCYPCSSSLRENARVSASFACCNMLSFQSTCSSSPRKGVSRRALQEDEFPIHTSPDNQTINQDRSNQERIIALFGRIRNLISEGESESRNDTSIQQCSSEEVNSEHKELSIRKGRKPRKEKSKPKSQHSTDNKLTRLPSNFVKRSPIPSPTPLRSNSRKFASDMSIQQSGSEQENSDHSELLTRKGKKPEKEKVKPKSQHSSDNKLNRLPFNFAKKSPIPSPTSLRSKGHNVADEEGSTAEAHTKPEQFVMKLSELKGLAKERGIRGYSKLKKSELIELLKFHV